MQPRQPNRQVLASCLTWPCLLLLSGLLHKKNLPANSKWFLIWIRILLSVKYRLVHAGQLFSSRTIRGSCSNACGTYASAEEFVVPLELMSDSHLPICWYMPKILFSIMRQNIHFTSGIVRALRQNVCKSFVWWKGVKWRTIQQSDISAFPSWPTRRCACGWLAVLMINSRNQ